MKIKAFAILFSILLTVNCCWDVGYGPYGSDKGYCKYKNNDSGASMCVFIQAQNENEKLNACMLAKVIEKNKCKNKSETKPYWF